MKQISSIIHSTTGSRQVQTFLGVHVPTATVVSITHTVDLDLYAVSADGRVQEIYYAEPYRALAHAQQIAEYGL